MPLRKTAMERARERWPRIPLRLLKALVLVKETAGETARGFRADRGADLASSLAFATLLTAVPLLATFSLVLAAFFRENVNGILEAVNAILPYHTARVTGSLREFVSESTTISGIGLVILVLASLRLISTIERIVNAVWGAPSRRDWLSRISLYLVVLFALTLLFGGFGLGIQMLRTTPAATSLARNVAVSFFPFAIEVAGLTLLYRFLPNARVHWFAAAIAGGTGGALLEVLRALFGIYVRTLSRVNLITGSLTFILLSLISVFLVWVVILIGVELTHVLQTHSAKKRSIGGIRAGRAENAIRMLLLLSTGGVQGIDSLYREQEANSHEAEHILECLRENGLVRPEGSRAFSLAVAPEKLTVAEIVDAVSPNLYSISPEEQDKVVTILEPIFERLDAERRTLLSATLADLKTV